MAEKCFCNIRDKVTGEVYLVKDSTARNQLSEHEARIQNLEAGSGGGEGGGVDTYAREQIASVSKTVTAHENRITALESNTGGGGAGSGITTQSVTPTYGKGEFDAVELPAGALFYMITAHSYDYQHTEIVRFLDGAGSYDFELPGDTTVTIEVNFCGDGHSVWEITRSDNYYSTSLTIMGVYLN